MTYSELIDRLSEELNLSKDETRSLLEHTVSELANQLGQGYSFTIPGLGTFRTKVKDVQKVYSPDHEKYMLIPPKRVVEFSPVSSMKEHLKNSRPDDE